VRDKINERIIVKLIPTNLSVLLARQLLKTKKHSPAIMFGAGVAGAVTATVLACKATLLVDDILMEAEKDRAKMDEAIIEFPERYTEEKRQHDLHYVRVKTAVKIGKLYAPAVGVGLVSIGLLTGAHVVLTKRNAGLTAAYVALDKGFREYRDRVIKEYGEDKDRELRYGTVAKEIVEEGEHGHEVRTIKRNAVTGKSIYARIYDENNRHWSQHPADNKAFLVSQQSWANDRLRAYGYLMLNDVYDQLGLDRSTAGAVVGWVKGYGGDDFVDFGLGDMSDPVVYDFMINLNGTGLLLDFNVDGPVYELIDKIENKSSH
jgi:hypothetical protein